MWEKGPSKKIPQLPILRHFWNRLSIFERLAKTEFSVLFLLDLSKIVCTHNIDLVQYDIQNIQKYYSIKRWVGCHLIFMRKFLHRPPPQLSSLFSVYAMHIIHICFLSIFVRVFGNVYVISNAILFSSFVHVYNVYTQLHMYNVRVKELEQIGLKWLVKSNRYCRHSRIQRVSVILQYYAMKIVECPDSTYL